MRIQDQASPHDVIGVGLAFSVAGLYFMLGAAGYLPMPETNGPSFIVGCAGAAFLFAGLTCMVRARAGALAGESNLPDSTPAPLRLSYRMFAIATAGALATISTWVAIGSGPRLFNVSSVIGETSTAGESIGRTVFALGAVIVWIYLSALTVGTVRKHCSR